MNEQEQWDRAIEIANTQIQGTDFMTVAEWAEDDGVDDATLRATYDKLMRLRANGDEHHSMEEMYRYRMLYNAALFNAWHQAGAPAVRKSWRHSDGEQCFGGGWFIVVAMLPTGQISNHYKSEHWDLFDIPDVELPPEYDGHTPQIAAERLERYLAGDYRQPVGCGCSA